MKNSKNVNAIIFCFVFLIFNVLETEAQTTISEYLSGVIKDKNETPIPYVNIGIPSSAFGLTTNENGEFKFKVTTEREIDTVLISSIGYKKQMLGFVDFKNSCEAKKPIYLTEEVYELSAVTITGVDYETEIFGNSNTEDLECIDIPKMDYEKDSVESAKIKQKQIEKGVDKKAIGIEFCNQFNIKKGKRTFIDEIQFKSCEDVGDTAIYRINIYTKGKIAERYLMLKTINFNNILKKPIIVKAIGKTEVHKIDLTDQNIEVSSDFIVGLECIYSSSLTMKIGAKGALYGDSNLYMRFDFMDDWLKLPVIDITFISASVRYEKKKSFFKFWK